MRLPIDHSCKMRTTVSRKKVVLEFHSAPDSRLRNLTLGVIIACGGAIAALPFRRVHSKRESLDASVRATGPTFTPLDAAVLDIPLDMPQVAPVTMASSKPWPSATAPPHSPMAPSRWQELVQEPASYGSSDIQIDKPSMVAEQYSASVEFQAQAAQARRGVDHAAITHPGQPLIGAKLPASTVPVVPHRFTDISNSTELVTDSLAIDSLANDKLAVNPTITAMPTVRHDTMIANISNRAKTEPAVSNDEPAPELPPITSVERPRFWIRQPD